MVRGESRAANAGSGGGPPASPAPLCTPPRASQRSGGDKLAASGAREGCLGFCLRPSHLLVLFSPVSSHPPTPKKERKRVAPPLWSTNEHLQGSTSSKLPLRRAFWGVAEVPQIITNYRQKSTEGLSIAFLMTWIVGDLFNLVGCFMEPATLPTQFYMALLYTITTLILTGQTLYYSHIYHRLKAKKARATSKPQRHQRVNASLREKLLGSKDNGESRNNRHLGAIIPIPSCPMPVNTGVRPLHGPSSLGSEYYYTSARSLSSSPVAIAATWLANRHPINTPEINDQKESLVGEFAPAQSAPSSITNNSLSVVPWMSLLLGMSVLHFLVGTTHREIPNGIVIPVGRRLLLLVDDHADSSLNHVSGSGIGSFLGWAMAVIYMGGRLPQILLNVILHR
ncbi:hypothetical protein GUJ93_ZPchr0001g31136 [Zizania palustris]|uniref:Uncharacterized protein n=1 Tax=Zizania palustris TaxID=103762 RepID=A0A8J5VQZ6_ZIZPA|nr:hypothetical protein GUJ93_ZPchr0001g31136 [Zizania palustris]KAG8052460.1 hypothetical protein GUJ93_ZPchr0001g31136 [Zizania palustris]KAG8052461.1 hypothetical protein GUJ93_ZPchr0001g31136 [Zizania palustris]